MKTERKVKLTGYTIDLLPARIGDEVHSFRDSITAPKFCVTIGTAVAYLATGRGKYTLTKHPTLNSYFGVCNGVKARLNRSKIKATLTYWA